MNELDPIPQPAPDYTPPDFIVETVTDESGIRATIGTMLPGYFLYGYPVLCVVLLLLGFVLILASEWGIGFLAMAVGALCLIFRLNLPRRTVNRRLARFRESYGTEAVPCQLVFWPQGVVVNNRISGGCVNLRYEIIRTITRKGDYIAFRTQEKQSVILRMADIECQPDFLPYFLSKCPKAKKKGL